MPILRRLHTYTVHINPKLDAPYERAEIVREGITFWGFVFGPFWLLAKKIWLPGIIVLALVIAAPMLHKAGIITYLTMRLGILAVQVATAVQGHDWWRAQMAKKGYILADIVTAETQDRATRVFFERHVNAVA